VLGGSSPDAKAGADGDVGFDATHRQCECYIRAVLYPFSRAVLFRLDPETAHHLAIRGIARAGTTPGMRETLAARYRKADAHEVEAFGLRFSNRVGLAAGWDKDGLAWRGLAALGFGHVEVGTVTPEPQPGNPRPRVFRLREQRSLINRMGFPGDGAVAVAKRVAGGDRPYGLVLGVNIGKQKTTPIEDALDDYEELVDVFGPLADYLAVNISSPNTPGLRRLQEPEFLGALLGGIATRRDEVAGRINRPVPVLVKLAPDLDDDQLRTAADAVLAAGLDGLIATNTTLAREPVAAHPLAGEEGGLSGAALTAQSVAVVGRLRDHVGPAVPIIGVGGIMGPDDAAAMLDAGATLLQIYTGFIYEGPGLVRRILDRVG
jgi:dihydroorotate dehydrogenase